jgi:hypothetical protein
MSSPENLPWILFIPFAVGVGIWGNFLYHFLARLGIFKKKCEKD